MPDQSLALYIKITRLQCEGGARIPQGNFHNYLFYEEVPCFQNLSPQTKPESLGPSAIPIDAATNALGSVINLLALFRTDTTVKSIDVTIEEGALVSEVVRHIKSQIHDAEAIYPSLYLPGLLPAISDNSSDRLSSFSSSEMLSTFQSLGRKRVRAEQMLTRNEPQKLGGPNPLTAKSALIKSLNDEYEKLSTYLSSVDKAGGSPLSALLRAEVLNKVLKNKNSGILYVKVLVSGAKNKNTRNLITGSKFFTKAL